MVALLASTFIFPPNVWSDDTEKLPPEYNPRTLETFLSDGAYVVTSPLRFDQRTSLLAAGALGLTAASALLDEEVRDHFIDSKNDPSTKKYESLSDATLLIGPVVGAGLFFHGKANDNEYSKETGYLTYESFLWVLGIERTINYIVGRERPNSTDDPFSFNPFHVNTSFTSGHTAQAFAAATVFSEQYPRWYVIVPSYSIASFTAYSRIHASRHWLSDVVGGSMLGMYIAHTLRTHRRRDDHKESAWDVNFDGEKLNLVRHF